MATTEVNGFFNNPHWVMAGQVEPLKRYISKDIDEALLGVISRLALHQPAGGKVQPFILEALKDTDAGRPTSKSRVVDASATQEYFQTTVDPILSELLRSLSVAQPDDPKAFLTNLLTTHADLESTLMGYTVAGAGTDPFTVRSGMNLSGKRVLVEMVVDKDGAATFKVFNPLVSKSALLKVEADNEALSTLLREKGTVALYHCPDHITIVQEADSTDFRLEWE